ncbi:hypothetical protein G210_1901 [Candida maltosa Xu316]|uniref:Aldehyde dehydrogenase domain-containing protein n=1 Tax=Candida maltosa (strain Xu316) TaxID=1245528 RepID=M3JXJ6_CANMX|nr:hypothetical protein G210_1901 [Candida maltosa Xu316]
MSKANKTFKSIKRSVSSSKSSSVAKPEKPSPAKIQPPELQKVEPFSDDETPVTKVSVRRSSKELESVDKDTNGSVKTEQKSEVIPKPKPVESKPKPVESKTKPVESKPKTESKPLPAPPSPAPVAPKPASIPTKPVSATEIIPNAPAVKAKPVDKKQKSEVAVETKSVAETIESKPEPVNTTTNSKDSILQYTEISQIPIGVKRVTDGFRSEKTHSLQFRLKQLRNLYFVLKDNQDAICEALAKDFNRSPSETKNYEISVALNELLFTMSKLHKWSQPQPVDELPLNLSTNPVYVERIPLGTVLVISAFNYPFSISVSPIAGAIAAGNTVVLKPSELTPNFSQLFTGLLTKALDPDVFFAVNGAIPETTELLNQKFDKIVYTGNNLVGTIIAKKAAETLTPVILELGGKSPAFILDDVADKDLPTIARRVAWGRYANGGQTCIGVDYVLVAESKHDKFIAALKEVIEKEFFPNIDAKSNFTHMIHDRAFQRMENIINTTSGKVIIGGKTDSKSRFVSPTVIDNVDWSDSSMKEEIFGPILPILTYSSLEKACRDIIDHHDTPLAQYIFTSGPTNKKYNSQINTIATLIRSGGLVINDVLMHFSLHNAPFGGIGSSGTGAYHGEYSYRAFTHERTVLEQHLWNDWVIKSRYPPFSNKKDRLVSSSQRKYGGKVWFGRTGDVRIDGPTTFFTAWSSVVGVANIVYDFVGSSL